LTLSNLTITHFKKNNSLKSIIAITANLHHTDPIGCISSLSNYGTNLKPGMFMYVASSYE